MRHSRLCSETRLRHTQEYHRRNSATCRRLSVSSKRECGWYALIRLHLLSSTSPSVKLRASFTLTLSHRNRLNELYFHVRLTMKDRTEPKRRCTKNRWNGAEDTPRPIRSGDIVDFDTISACVVFLCIIARDTLVHNGTVHRGDAVEVMETAVSDRRRRSSWYRRCSTELS